MTDDLEGNRIEIERLKELVETYKENLHSLVLEKASQGYNTGIINQIKECKKQIKSLRNRLYSVSINRGESRLDDDKLEINDRNELLSINKVDYNLIRDNLDFIIKNGVNINKYSIIEEVFIEHITYESDYKLLSDKYMQIYSNIDISGYIKREILFMMSKFICIIYSYFDSDIEKFENIEVSEILKIFSPDTSRYKKYINFNTYDSIKSMIDLCCEIGFMKTNNDFVYIEKYNFLETAIYILYKNNIFIENDISNAIFRLKLINKDILNNGYIFDIILKNEIYNFHEEDIYEMKDKTPSILHYLSVSKYNYINKYTDYMFYRDIIPLSLINKIVINEFNGNFQIINGEISISKYLVSNADFRCFIEDNSYHKLQFWSFKGIEFLSKQKNEFQDKAVLKDYSIGLWNYPKYWFHYGYNHDLQPVVGISYYEAEAYCNWLTYKGYEQGWLDSTEEIRLPTLAERINIQAIIADTQTQNEDTSIQNIRMFAHTRQSNNVLFYPACIDCFPQYTEVGEMYDVFGNVAEWTSTAFNVDDRATHLITGGTFDDSLEEIIEKYRFLLQVVEYTNQGYSIVDAETKVIDAQEYPSSLLDITYASSRFHNLGFRIVRALIKE